MINNQKIINYIDTDTYGLVAITEDGTPHYISENTNMEDGTTQKRWVSLFTTRRTSYI